jgi:hypothetical protein
MSARTRPRKHKQTLLTIPEAYVKLRRQPPPAPARAEPPTEADPDVSADLPYGIERSRLDRQLDSVDIVDAKISNLLSWGAGIATLLAAVFAVRPARFSGIALGAFIIALVAFTGLAVTALVATFPRRWKTGPRGRDVRRDYLHGKSPISVQWKAIRAFEQSVDLNAAPIETKGNRATLCYWLFTVETAAVLGGLAVLASTH